MQRPRLREQLAASDRVLLIAPPDGDWVEDWLRQLKDGSMVILGKGDSLYETRQRLAGFENVMVIPGHRDEIPWSDAFFTMVVDLDGASPSREIERVLAPSGRRTYSVP